MSDFTDALSKKMNELKNKRDVHLMDVQTIDAKLAVLNELYLAEAGEPAAVAEPSLAIQRPKKKRGGRPKGSKNKKTAKGESKHAVADELYDEAMSQLARSGDGGTSPELQEKLTRRFNPTPKPARELGPGITAGTKKDVEAAKERRTPHARISIDEGE